MYRTVLAIITVLLISSACSTVSGPVVPGFSGMQGMLTVHNQVRGRLGLPPLNWSGELSAYSREWANYLAGSNSCRMRHRADAGKNHRNFGENLFWGSPLRWSDGRVEPQQITAAGVARDWASEMWDYHYASNSCRPGAQCGHYTQMIWRDTKQVGCAMSLCPDLGQIWVCSYNPPGNWVGQRPY